MCPQPQSPPEVFISYSSKDKRYKDELLKQLKVLAQQDVISTWHDGLLVPGQQWDSQIVEHLNSSRVILLLISPDFLTSDYVNKVELKLAAERHTRKEACVIPVLVRNVNAWESQPFGELKLADLHAVPSSKKFIVEWANRNKAFADVADGIQRAVEKLKPIRKTPITPPPPVPTSHQTAFVIAHEDNSRDIPRRLEANLIARMEPPKSLEVFYCYSRHDEALRDQLDSHLSMLKRQGIINGWHDRRIGAGRDWEGQISEHLSSAWLILLLVSSDFLASDYCYDVEVRKAMERHEAGEARVVPIILRTCDWLTAPFGKLQALPKDAKPVKRWEDQDEAFVDVVRGLRQAVEEYMAANIPLLPTPTHLLNPTANINSADNELRSKLVQLQQFEREELIEESVKTDYQRRLLDKWVERS